jgi:hypothetical protein
VGPTALPIGAGPGYNGQRVAAAEGKEGEGGFFFLYFLGMSNMNVLFYSVDIKMATLVQQVDLVAGKQSNSRFWSSINAYVTDCTFILIPILQLEYKLQPNRTGNRHGAC